MPDESDVRILIHEIKTMKDVQQSAEASRAKDYADTAKELKNVARELHEVAKNLVADRGRIDRLEDNDKDKESRLRNVEGFVIASKPKSAGFDRIITSLITAAILFAASHFYTK